MSRSHHHGRGGDGAVAPRRSTLTSAVVFAAVLLLGCASRHVEGFPSDSSARPLTDAPTQFALSTSTSAAARAPTDICQNPLVDQRHGTTLRLVRSQPGRGDYEVPVGVYGVQAGDLVRVDCRSLQPIGLVRR